MAYITEFNLKRIIKQSNYKDQNFELSIYDKADIDCLNKNEVKELQAIQLLLKNPVEYFKRYYEPISNIDNFKFVFRPQKPAYHSSLSCERLKSDFLNYTIPDSIREKGKKVVAEFRSWYIENMDKIETDPALFAFRLKTRWNIDTNPQNIKYENSGAAELKIESVEIIESIVDSLVEKASWKAQDSEKDKIILRRFSKCTFLVNSSDAIKDNNTGYLDEEVREVLKKYDSEIKKPLKKYLIDYYISKYNSSIEIEKELLDLAGFRGCGKCYRVL